MPDYSNIASPKVSRALSMHNHQSKSVQTTSLPLADDWIKNTRLLILIVTGDMCNLRCWRAELVCAQIHNKRQAKLFLPEALLLRCLDAIRHNDLHRSCLLYLTSGSNRMLDCPGMRRLELMAWCKANSVWQKGGLMRDTLFMFSSFQKCPLKSFSKIWRVWQCSCSFYCITAVKGLWHRHKPSLTLWLAHVRHLVSVFGWVISGAWLCYWSCFTTEKRFMVLPIQAIQDTKPFVTVMSL